MQFPVPQFTDVEDKIIGPLTIKQFGILFGLGVVLFLGYSATKSIIVLIFLFLILGIPGLSLAFAKINGRPVYNSIGYFVKFFLSPKVMVFHKEAVSLRSDAEVKDANLKSDTVTKQSDKEDTQDNLRKVQQLLRQTQDQEEEMVRARSKSQE
ncbi:MAG: PrgI family protein [Candidatus Doudnabacteria bacterium]|nr:PrgI family protein [Candidatus Doudnabacteria bacterium]